MWVLSFPAFAMGLAILTDFRGITSRLYNREARSWKKAGISADEYKATQSFNAYRYSVGIFLCVASVVIAVLYGVIGT